VFFKTWQDHGFMAAMRTIPAQIRAFGRAIQGLLSSIGLGRFGDAIKRQFNDISHFFDHTVDLIDDVIHGRWSQVWGDLWRIAVDNFHFLIDGLRGSVGLIRDVFDLIPWGAIGTALGNGFIAALTYLVTVGIPVGSDGKARR
jgi:hypothetical protein